jgi:hypothetical protein
MRMCRIHCLLAATTLSAACAASGAWWQQDLQAWVGAPLAELVDAWGPPMRALTAESGKTLLVYESFRELDRRDEQLRDPGALLREEPPEGRYSPVDRSECTLYFELVDERVAAARHEGAACAIVPRDPARRQAEVPKRRR